MQSNSTHHNVNSKKIDIQHLHKELVQIRTDMIGEVEKNAARLARINPKYQASARNLLHYLVLRRRDIRPLQLHLAELGLSSLGRAESHVLATIDAVLNALSSLIGSDWLPPQNEIAQIKFDQGAELLAKHTQSLLGSAAAGRGVRIMVTMPGEAANDYTLIYNLMKQGMDCMRINCAHDDVAAWTRMIDHLRRAEKALSKRCKIAMDLGGPKLRTGALQAGPAVIRIRPCRDIFGRVIAPARIWLGDELNMQLPPSAASASLPLPKHWLAEAVKGEWISFTDARNATRRMEIVDVTEQGCWAEMKKTAYIIPGTVLHHERKLDKKKRVMQRLEAWLPLSKQSPWPRVMPLF